MDDERFTTPYDAYENLLNLILMYRRNRGNDMEMQTGYHEDHKEIQVFLRCRRLRPLRQMQRQYGTQRGGLQG